MSGLCTTRTPPPPRPRPAGEQIVSGGLRSDKAANSREKVVAGDQAVVSLASTCLYLARTRTLATSA